MSASALIITCESLNNQSLQIGPVLERMMDSFRWLPSNSAPDPSKNDLFKFEHFESQVGR